MARKSSDARIRANMKYDRANKKTYAFKLNIKYDADLIEKMESVPSKAAYIKQLIRDDIEKEEK